MNDLSGVHLRSITGLSAVVKFVVLRAVTHRFAHGMPYDLSMMFGLLLAVNGCGNAPIAPDLEDQVRQITLSADSTSLLRGDSTSISAAAFDSSGNALVITLKWMSADTSVVVVDSTGWLYAAGSGITELSVSAGNISRKVRVSVSDPPERWSFLAPGCGVWSDGAVYCWRWEHYGGAILQPERVASADRFRSVHMGERHRCAVSIAGAAYCWGENAYGQLGDGTTMDRAAPVRVALDKPVKALATGSYHTCAVDIADALFCWGAGRFGQLGSPLDQLCGQRQHPCSPSPLQVSSGVGFAAVGAGGYDPLEVWGHSCSIRMDGQVLCWGLNAYGQLGNGSKANASEPQAIASTLRFQLVVAGNFHSCALSAGVAYCWGSNSEQQLGGSVPGGTETICGGGDIFFDCSALPIRVEAATHFSDIAAKGETSCGITRRGAIYCWGFNLQGQAGQGGVPPNAPVQIARPAQVKSNALFTDLTVGVSFACGVAPNGSAYCWGNGSGVPHKVPDPF